MLHLAKIKNIEGVKAKLKIYKFRVCVKLVETPKRHFGAVTHHKALKPRNQGNMPKNQLTLDSTSIVLFCS